MTTTTFPETEHMAANVKAMLAETFKAWRIVGGKSYPLDVSEAKSPDEALALAVIHCAHLDHLEVLQIHTGQKRNTRRVYAIKRESKPSYRRGADGTTERWNKLYPVELFAVAMEAFVPAEPWRWTPGADVVGIDRQMVEQG